MKNIGIKYGLLGGTAVVFYFALVYFAQKGHFLNPFVQWASMAFYLIFMYKAAADDLAQNGGERDFRELSRTPFLAFLLINLFYWVFYYALHLADPEILQMENAAQLAHLKAQLSAGTGDPDQANQIREQILYLEKPADGRMPLGPVVLRMGMGAIGGFGLAAALVAILKNR